ncbi:uncharacterized protein SCHCODRAFT_0109602, partial [Schizophyllum commune H4-8]|uniref:uncharacterized protein n=1 Tax=Schizophyllum commune (strain H4-8 / FGSC 9210) TaxID=578458 RepID=UPI00215E8793
WRGALGLRFPLPFIVIGSWPYLIIGSSSTIIDIRLCPPCPTSISFPRSPFTAPPIITTSPLNSSISPALRRALPTPTTAHHPHPPPRPRPPPAPGPRRAVTVGRHCGLVRPLHAGFVGLPSPITTLPTPAAWRLPRSANLTVEVAVCGAGGGGGDSASSRARRAPSGGRQKGAGDEARRRAEAGAGGDSSDGSGRSLTRRATTSAPRFFLTNATGLTGDGPVDEVDPATVPGEGDVGEDDVYEVSLDGGGE